MYKTNSNEEVSVRLIGKLSLEIPSLADLQQQLIVKKVIDEVLYNYDVMTKETGLITSDIEDKINMFLACRRLDGLSYETLDNYKLVLFKFADFYHKPLISVTSMDIRVYLSRVYNNHKSSTVNTIISTLKTFFSWCVNEEYLVKNAMSKINLTKTEKRIRKAMNEEQVELLRKACITTRERAVFEFLISTGCRVGEIISINKRDINWSEMSLNVVGKGNKERKIYFSTKSKLLLKDYLKDRKGESGDNSLFCASKYPYDRLSTRAVEREIKNISERSNVDINVFPHLCRHTFATSRLNSSMRLETLQSLLGHENPSTTLIYARLSEENIKHEYRKTS